MRPMLVMLSYSIFKKDAEKIVSYAAAVEAFHNFTLMHDDIMDKAPLRRGKATVHEKWNVNTAILSGDVMLVRVYDMFLSLEGPKLNQVLRAFNQCAAEVCEGQQWDMEFESKAKVTEAQYIEMIRLKTAVLLGFSLELGAILADAPKADQIALREFGVNIGIGFQLKDDLLDVYADQKKFGKQVGGDIIYNKKTFLLIKALEKAKGKQQKELKEWLSAKKFNAKKKVTAITGIYNSLGIAEQTELKVNWYFEKGFDQLNEVDTNGSLLIDFTQELMARQA